MIQVRRLDWLGILFDELLDNQSFFISKGDATVDQFVHFLG